MKCKVCSSDNVIRYGFNRLKNSKKQKYLCKDCGLIYSNPNCLKGFRKSKVFVGQMIDLHNLGISFYKLSHRFHVSSSTVYNWFMKFPERFGKIIESKIQMAKFSSARHIDETELPIRKKKIWNPEHKRYEMVDQKIHLWAMEDNVTKFVNCFYVSPLKDSESCTIFLSQSINHPRPGFIITDDAFAFRQPIEIVLNSGEKNWKKPKVKHIPITKSDPRFKEYKGVNNLIERLFQTAKSRTKVTRRYRKIESIRKLMFMFLLHYNFLKFHRTIRKTPADQAGIGLGKRRIGFYDLMLYFGIT